MSRNPFRNEATSLRFEAVEGDDGEAVYRVPLSNPPGCYATLDKHGLDLLLSRGVKFLTGVTLGGSGPYVQALKPGSLYCWDTISRLIASPAPGQWVRYANGDSTDLRRSNLVLFTPKAKAAA